MIKKIVILIIAVVQMTSMFGQDWHTDFSAAQSIAQEEEKPIVLVFQGSDWCAPCIKLDKEIWSTDTFQSYAADHFVMVQADFPRKKNALPEELTQQNAELAETYNKRGFFPFVVVLDHEGNVLGETSYKKTTPEDYINILNSFIQ